MAPAPPPVEAAELMATTQGDILCGGIPKKNETFVFYGIQDAKLFCEKLYFAMIMGLFSSGKFTLLRREYIDTTKIAIRAQLPDAPNKISLLPMAIAQISFSATGIMKLQEVHPEGSLGITQAWKTRDEAFFRGMEADAADPDQGLRDPMSQWEEGFKGRKIDGVFTIAGSDALSVQEVFDSIKIIFGSSISVVHTESGEVRKGDYKDREHFGFNDGVSQPTVEGFGPDREKVPDGEVGELGNKWNTFSQSTFLVQDADGSERPKWLKHGSFLVYRKLEQDVKKWREDITADAQRRGIDPTLLAAKIVGRWPSGCPVMTRTDKDDDTQAFNNQFDFTTLPRENEDDAICPVGSHIRKMNPHRAVVHDDGGAIHEGRIIRRGITYGTDYDENQNDNDRGLHFVCYQSSIEDGFRNIQMFWANPDEFPASAAGVDVFMGNQLQEGVSKMYVADDDKKKNGSHFVFKGFNPYVKARGGEYFFTPSFTALTETLAIGSPAS